MKTKFQFRIETPQGIVFEGDDVLEAMDRLKKEPQAVLFRNQNNAPLALMGEVKRTRTKKSRPKK